MCSGFFTGDAEHMRNFCDAIQAKFLEALEAGYGHADEQLFSMVYFDHRDWFEHYYGDYREMVTNYVNPVDRPYEPVRLLITHSFDNRDYAVCETACEKVWGAWKKGVVSFDDGQLREFLRIYRECLRKQGKGIALP
jgi:hypothetical protein